MGPEPMGFQTPGRIQPDRPGTARWVTARIAPGRCEDEKMSDHLMGVRQGAGDHRVVGDRAEAKEERRER
jgi:hypothetical protein